MPAVGSHRQLAPVDILPAVPTRAVNNIISLDKYYRSANLLLRQVQGLTGIIAAASACQALSLTWHQLTHLPELQADAYRAAGNEWQLYTMLLRFAGYLPFHTAFWHKACASEACAHPTCLPWSQASCRDDTPAQGLPERFQGEEGGAAIRVQGLARCALYAGSSCPCSCYGQSAQRQPLKTRHRYIRKAVVEVYGACGCSAARGR